MECREAEEAINASIDGELERGESQRLEAHLRGCASCRRALERARQMSLAIRQSAERFIAPEGLATRIGQALEAASSPRVSRSGPSWRQLGLAASFLLVAVLSSGLTYRLAVPGEADRIGEEVISGHVRALVSQHMTDVTSTDQHTVKPWFNGRLDLSPPVVDLAHEDFPLIGGRLDYMDGHPVAALVYGHRKHLITLYVWNGRSGAVGPRMMSERGYNAEGWSRAGTVFWAVSDINREDLQRFVKLYSSEAAS